jgi:hypothetical protein
VEVADHVRLGIDQFERGEYEAALLHGCIAIDGTARRAGLGKDRSGFLSVLREAAPVLGAMALPGIDIVKTRFLNLRLPWAKEPDFADVIYEAFRCALAHGEPLPDAYIFHPSVGHEAGQLTLGKGHLGLPDYLPFGLFGVAVSHPANSDQRVPDGVYLSIAHERFEINEWWGRRDEWVEAAERNNPVKVVLEGLERLLGTEAGPTASTR